VVAEPRDRGVPSGFRNSVASYTVSLLNPKIIRDLDLPGTGCASSNASLEFPPDADGRYLIVGGAGPTRKWPKFSVKDAARLDEYGERPRCRCRCSKGPRARNAPNAVEGSWRARSRAAACRAGGGRLRNST